MRRYDRCYIDGEWVEPAGTAEFELVNPTTEMPFATLRLGNAAVGAARRALP